MNTASRRRTSGSAHGSAKYIHQHPNVEPDAGDRQQRRVDRPARLAVDERVQRGDGADDHLAERDDHEQPVALGDVLRVPRRLGLALGDERAGDLEREQRDRYSANVVATGRSTNTSATHPTWAIPIVVM